MAAARASNGQLATEGTADCGYAPGKRRRYGALADDGNLDRRYAFAASDAAVSNEPGRRGIGCSLPEIVEARSW